MEREKIEDFNILQKTIEEVSLRITLHLMHQSLIIFVKRDRRINVCDIHTIYVTK